MPGSTAWLGEGMGAGEEPGWLEFADENGRSLGIAAVARCVCSDGVSASWNPSPGHRHKVWPGAVVGFGQGQGLRQCARTCLYASKKHDKLVSGQLYIPDVCKKIFIVNIRLHHISNQRTSGKANNDRGEALSFDIPAHAGKYSVLDNPSACVDCAAGKFSAKQVADDGRMLRFVSMPSCIWLCARPSLNLKTMEASCNAQ